MRADTLHSVYCHRMAIATRTSAATVVAALIPVMWRSPSFQFVLRIEEHSSPIVLPPDRVILPIEGTRSRSG